MTHHDVNAGFLCPGRPSSLDILIGSNLSGRSDHLRCLAGLDSERRMAYRAAYIGMDVESSLSGLTMTVRQELDLHLGWKPLPPSLQDLVEKIGIVQLYDRNPGVLSGGEQAKLALCCALALAPKTVALDSAIEQMDWI